MTATTSGAQTLRSETIARAAARLTEAGRTRRPCAPVRGFIGTDDPELAYAVQHLLTQQRLGSGRRVVGRKIGLTSPAVQQQLGVDRPDFGVLFDDMRCTGSETVDIGRLMQPKIEAEIAFVLKDDLTDPESTATSVRAYVDYAVAALEIVDSRIADWDITYSDTVADNGSSGLFVLGDRQLQLDEFEPIDGMMTMSLDGEVASTGSGAACLGDPLNALAWLARIAVQFGDPLRAGQIILSGALGPMVAVHPGAIVHADITGLGSVEATFSATS